LIASQIVYCFFAEIKGILTKFMKQFLYGLITVCVLSVVLVVVLYFIDQRTNIMPSASSAVSNKTVSSDNSYVFASPVRALTGGDLIRITVFVLDENGKGLFDREVDIKGDETKLTINKLQEITDSSGKALFDISGKIKGTYFLQAEVDGLIIKQNAKIIFD